MMAMLLLLLSFLTAQPSEKTSTNNITVTQNPTIILVKESAKRSRIVKHKPLQQDPDDNVVETGCCCFLKLKSK